MFRAALFILSGNATTSVLLLGRYLLIAALLPIDDFGVAATFALVVTAVEMATNFGLQQQIVQTRDASVRLQSALQGFQVLRGFLAGVLVFMIAEPFAQFLKLPDVAWAYQWLAIVPLMNAMQHFDIHRHTRSLAFAPLILTNTIPAFITFAAVWPLAYWLNDYRVMLWSTLLHSALGMILSHATASRKFKLAWDPELYRQSLHFGWPLLLNSALLFCVFQGDKLIVGRVLGMEELAVFAMGVTLTLSPTLVLARSAQNFLLPQVKDGFSELVTLEACIAVSVVFAVLVATFGSPLVSLLLGSEYSSLGLLMPGLAVMQGARLCKAGPAIVALARGETSNSLWGNAPRLFALWIVWLVADSGYGLYAIVWIGALAELCGLAIAWHRLGRITISLQFENLRTYCRDMER